jgi:hypothetical protein
MTSETQTDELEAMQDRALHHDITLTDPTGRELTVEELRPLVENAEAAMAQLTPEAKLNEKRATEQAMEEANSGGQRSVAVPIAPPSITSNAPGSRTLRAPLKVGPAPINPELAQKLGMDKATDEDIALAKRHNYPVVIPGAKAYVTDISMRCALGGGERPAGSVILLTEAHARNKLEYLSPVDDEQQSIPLPVSRDAPVQPAQTQVQPSSRPAQQAAKGKQGQGKKSHR